MAPGGTRERGGGCAAGGAPTGGEGPRAAPSQSGDPATARPSGRNGGAPASFPGPGGPWREHPRGPTRQAAPGVPVLLAEQTSRRPAVLRCAAAPGRWPRVRSGRAVAVGRREGRRRRGPTPTRTGASHDPRSPRLRPPRPPRRFDRLALRPPPRRAYHLRPPPPRRRARPAAAARARGGGGSPRHRLRGPVRPADRHPAGRRAARPALVRRQPLPPQGRAPVAPARRQRRGPAPLGGRAGRLGGALGRAGAAPGRGAGRGGAPQRLRVPTRPRRRPPRCRDRHRLAPAGRLVGEPTPR